MPVAFTNFMYDPSRDGYDADAWQTVFGTPYVSGGSLYVDQAATIHRGDCLRGTFTLNLNVPNSPTGGESRRWGMYSINTGAYAWFAIEDETFYAQTSDGGSNSSSTAIEWSDGVSETWNGNDIEYAIRWEAGIARFFVNGTLRATLSGASIPYYPLAIYFSNSNTDGFAVKYVAAQGVQSFYMHTDHSDTDVGDGPILVVESVSITESTTTFVQLGNLAPSDSLSISENVVNEVQLGDQSLSESVSITESTDAAFALGDTASEAVSITEDVTVSVV